MQELRLSLYDGEEPFPAVLQVRYQGFHEVAPMRFEQPHYTDATRLKLL